MPVVDFHIHCYDRPLRAPESFVAFMDREAEKVVGGGGGRVGEAGEGMGVGMEEREGG